MSHRYFNCDGIDVLAGYDVAEEHYFLVVSYNDEILFTSEELIDPKIDVRDIMRYMKRFMMTPPGSFYFDLACDETFRRDKVIKDYR